MKMRILAALALLAVGAPALEAQEHVSRNGHDHGAAGHETHGRATLLPGLGTWSNRITTTVPDAQRFFDQGLRLTYAFNHVEAARSFEEALRLDPSCAMCAWGIAYAVSPNINLPMDSAAEARGLAAIRTAQSLAGRVTPRERDMIEAMARRFGVPAGADRAQRDSAYASAMRVLAQKYPQDADIQVLFADAMMNLRPWAQWTREGVPQPGTLDVVSALERVVQSTPEHAGACHFYVHAVEASTQPERALPCAKRLAKLMPGAGHIVHMPAHVYLRVGQYEEAARANIAAVEADRKYFAGSNPAEGVYPMFYAPHNIHFLWAVYMMSGQQAKALGAARALTERVDAEAAVAVPSLQTFLVSEVLTHVRFGDWDAVLATPAPAGGLRYTKGMWHYARGVANAATGRLGDARAELDSVRAIGGAVREDMIIVLNPAASVLRLAGLVLEGRIASAHGDVDEAAALLREAARLEDELQFDEPPAWMEPVRQTLGAVLLAARRATEAEAVYREDLRWNRENGWSLRGLELALRAQGRTAEAADVSRRLAKAWEHADVQPDVKLQRVGFGSTLLPTGVRMHYAETGALTGEAVIFLHGYSDSWFSWSGVLPLLPASVRAIAVDMRGHGRTAYAGDEFTLRAMADDVAALMDRLGVIRATIVGHSLGSMVAQVLATEHPSRVGRVVLVGAIDRGTLPVVHELRAAVLAQPDPMPGEFVREFQNSTIRGTLPQPFIERVYVESGRVSTAAWQGIANDMVRFDYTAKLRDVDAPVLMIAGADDAYFPADVQERLRDAFRSARLVTYEDTGHAVHWERPVRFVNDLLSFVGSSVAAR